MHHSREKVIAMALFLGAGFLLYRTVTMLAEGALQTLAPWVVALLMLELIIDAIAMVVILAWAVGGTREQLLAVIRVTAAVILVHALRVGIFVLGRTGPWKDFDVKPAARAAHAERWTWDEVYFAASVSAFSVIALIVFWRYWRRTHPDLTITAGCEACVDPRDQE